MKRQICLFLWRLTSFLSKFLARNSPKKPSDLEKAELFVRTATPQQLQELDKRYDEVFKTDQE